MSQRVVFTFDEVSLQSLHQVTKQGDFKSMGAAVRESIQILDVVGEQAEEGFTELLVRNRKGKEKEVIVPSIQRIKRRLR